MKTRNNNAPCAWLVVLLALLGQSCAEQDINEMEQDGAASQANDAGAGDAAVSPSTTESRVTIDDGPLLGRAERNTHSFLGIPYAKPPVGPLRWKRPLKNETWQEPRDASKFGKRCAQLESTVLQNLASEDEDCLYLNVWTSDPQAKDLPVLFWIHGGGNLNGSASEPVPFLRAGVFYSGENLAQKGVVVVTVNYRLGALGFFAHPELAKESDGAAGNQGLYDQLLALDWVKRNIAKFGGDPNKVTIFGESAGSLDVCLHMASPKSRGLFHGAISQSGGCTTRNNTLAEGHKSSAALASALGCTGDGVLACLRGKSAKELLMPPTTAGAAAPSFGVVVDGDYLPDQARALFDRGEIAKVPYILGSNTDEGTLFVPSTLTLETEADLSTALTTQFPGADVAAIMAAYPLVNFPATAMKKSARVAFERIVGDARLVCATFDSAMRAVAAGAPGVWLYNFDVPVMIAGIELGATHGAELTFVFGTSPTFTPATEAVSERMQRYWTNFAKTGDPNGGGDLAWSRLSASENVRLNIGLESSLVSNFRAQECALWRAGYERAFASAP